LDAYLAGAKLQDTAPFPALYSNLGAGLLGELLARLESKSWEELVIERIAEPLGMSDTVVTLNAEQKQRLAPAYSGSTKVKHWTATSMAGAGALRSTAADMMKFGKALAKPEGTPMRQAIELLKAPQSDGSIGLFLQITRLKNGKSGYWMSGGTGGFCSWLSVRPHDSRIVVILFNNSECSPEEIISGRLNRYANNGPADPALGDFSGRYDTGVRAAGTAIHYLFEVKGKVLWMQITGQPRLPLERHPTQPDRFTYAPVSAEIQFTRQNGKVVSTTLFQAGMEIKATKLP
jgi:serine-type D-Ala-D-Ala carboxypeptidase/endopeptidase